MQCGTRYLPLCSIPKIVNRDGFGGENGKLYIPFCGFVFASGATFAPVGATVPQDPSRTIGGIVKPDTFSKGFTTNCGG